MPSGFEIVGEGTCMEVASLVCLNGHRSGVVLLAKPQEAQQLHVILICGSVFGIFTNPIIKSLAEALYCKSGNFHC